METRCNIEKSNRTILNFKDFIEMAHIAPQNGRHLIINGGDVQVLDMKFEKYPDVMLKRKLLSINSMFFGKMPNQMNSFLIYDGEKAFISHTPPTNDYVQLPNDWWDYVHAVFVNGEIKEPTKG